MFSEFENGLVRIRDRRRPHRVSPRVHLLTMTREGTAIACKPGIPMKRWAGETGATEATCGSCLRITKTA